MLTLYHAPNSRSSRFLWLLEEIGQPYTVQVVSMRRRVSSLTIGLPRRARDTVGCETPARYAMSMDVVLPCIPIPHRVSFYL